MAKDSFKNGQVFVKKCITKALEIKTIHSLNGFNSTGNLFIFPMLYRPLGRKRSPAVWKISIVGIINQSAAYWHAIEGMMEFAARRDFRHNFQAPHWPFFSERAGENHHRKWKKFLERPKCNFDPKQSRKF